MPEPAADVEGWAFPTLAAKKPHFFRGPDRRSLCGRYALIFIPSGLQIAPDTGTTSPADCAACARKLEATRCVSPK